MRVVVQRVTSAEVTVAGECIGKIAKGLLVLAGFEDSDTAEDLAWVSAKLVRLRIFTDDAGLMNLSVLDIAGEILVVSQFTLFASIKKGLRPSWSRAGKPQNAQILFQDFIRQLEKDLGRSVERGQFAADMRINLCNEGPVTLFIDSKSPE